MLEPTWQSRLETPVTVAIVVAIVAALALATSFVLVKRRHRRRLSTNTIGTPFLVPSSTREVGIRILSKMGATNGGNPSEDEDEGKYIDREDRESRSEMHGSESQAEVYSESTHTTMPPPYSPAASSVASTSRSYGESR